MSTLPPAPIVLPSRTEHALSVIKQGILSGRFAPGQSLVETELAQELAMSKTPVREALKTLEMSGLVVVRPYIGVRVRELSQEDAVAIYDTRLLLEPEAVRRSVANGADTSPARAALVRADAAVDAPSRSLANRAFHAGLWAGAQNPILIGVLDGLRDQTALAAVSTWAREPSWRDEAEEHARILDAAEAGEADRAAELTSRHIAGFLDRLRQGGAAR
ncbi:GntR family transcriptional regulator [Microbacterium betulae]|uniref:GntR family transcriptional regulator n=1 Tax=Microbacterium betulae TaxID=2981139 RepID=A0AA97FKX0_9MICO|nr:GntR family transcriptional regulator [Microbacterium sp. AB]WOF23964.1 GntR family transcriptional regulator [Microbacterium sp. AB]